MAYYVDVEFADNSELSNALEWTTDIPRDEGWYWARNTNGAHFIVKVGTFGLGLTGELWVYMIGNSSAMDFDVADYWLGPLPIPEPPSLEVKG